MMRKFLFFYSFHSYCLSYVLSFSWDVLIRNQFQIQFAADTVNVDTVAQDSVEEVIAEAPVPKAADELFDDFFFQFLWK